MRMLGVLTQNDFTTLRVGDKFWNGREMIEVIRTWSQVDEEALVDAVRQNLSRTISGMEFTHVYRVEWSDETVSELDDPETWKGLVEWDGCPVSFCDRRSRKLTNEEIFSTPENNPTKTYCKPCYKAYQIGYVDGRDDHYG